MFLKKQSLLFFLFCYPCACLAVKAIPDFFEADYTLYSNDTRVGLMQRRFFQNDDGRYTFRSEIRTTGLIAIFRKDHIIEQSDWQLSDAGFTPVHYLYQHTGGEKNRAVEINFDWDKKEITTRANKSIWHMQTQPGVLDKLLYQLAIMASLKAGKIPKSYTIADGGKIKQYLFEYIKDDVIETPLGEFKTMKLIRHRLNNNRKTFLWFAYELDFLPVKVMNEEKKNRTTTAIIKSLNGFSFREK